MGRRNGRNSSLYNGVVREFLKRNCPSKRALSLANSNTPTLKKTVSHYSRFGNPFTCPNDGEF